MRRLEYLVAAVALAAAAILAFLRYRWDRAAPGISRDQCPADQRPVLISDRFVRSPTRSTAGSSKFRAGLPTSAGSGRGFDDCLNRRAVRLMISRAMRRGSPRARFSRTGRGAANEQAHGRRTTVPRPAGRGPATGSAGPVSRRGDDRSMPQPQAERGWGGSTSVERILDFRQALRPVGPCDVVAVWPSALRHIRPRDSKATESGLEWNCISRARLWRAGERHWIRSAEPVVVSPRKARDRAVERWNTRSAANDVRSETIPMRLAPRQPVHRRSSAATSWRRWAPNYEAWQAPPALALSCPNTRPLRPAVRRHGADALPQLS